MLELLQKSFANYRNPSRFEVSIAIETVVWNFHAAISPLTLAFLGIGRFLKISIFDKWKFLEHNYFNLPINNI